MAITKTTVVDQITVTENGIILYREATKIIEDNKEHLEIMLAKDFWTTEDLQPFRDAIA
jgi:hypothetical protein